MSFTDEQIAELQAKLDGRHVKERKQGNQHLSYIESWWAISEANRIFGYDGWERETVETKCVWEGPRTIGAGGKWEKEGYGCTYTAKVRIVAWHGEGSIMREGCGAGHGISVNPGDAHESAIKEAESDAMKRALMTFGNPFGLALYDKEQSNVDKSGRTMRNGYAPNVQVDKDDSAALASNWTDQRIVEIADCKTENDLDDLFARHEKAIKKLKAQHEHLHSKLVDTFERQRNRILADSQAAGDALAPPI